MSISEAQIKRSNQFVDTLNHPIDCVLFFEVWDNHPDGGCWIVQGKQLDYCAQGKTQQEAFGAFRLGLLSTLSLNCDPQLAWLDPCPEKEWNDVAAQPTAKAYRLKLMFEETAQESSSQSSQTDRDYALLKKLEADYGPPQKSDSVE